jgi:hypothetical protein
LHQGSAACPPDPLGFGLPLGGVAGAMLDLTPDLVLFLASGRVARQVDTSIIAPEYIVHADDPQASAGREDPRIRSARDSFFGGFNSRFGFDPHAAAWTKTSSQFDGVDSRFLSYTVLPSPGPFDTVDDVFGILAKIGRFQRQGPVSEDFPTGIVVNRRYRTQTSMESTSPRNALKGHRPGRRLRCGASPIPHCDRPAVSSYQETEQGRLRIDTRRSPSPRNRKRCPRSSTSRGVAPGPCTAPLRGSGIRLPGRNCLRPTIPP